MAVLRFLIFYVVCLSPYAFADDPISVTIVGDSSYPPYSYMENGKLTGIYTDLINAIAPKMKGYTLKLQGLPWKRALLRVENGEAPFVFPPYFRQKERPYLRYSDPLLDEKLVMFCNGKVMLQPRNQFPDDFQGLRIGRNLGFLVGDHILQAGKVGLIRLISISNAATALRRMDTNKMDCYINDRLSVLYEFKVLQEKEKLYNTRLVEAAQFSNEQAYLAGSTNQDLFPFMDDFFEQFNQHLAALKANGTLDKIVAKYVGDQAP